MRVRPNSDDPWQTEKTTGGKRCFQASLKFTWQRDQEAANDPNNDAAKKNAEKQRGDHKGIADSWIFAMRRDAAPQEVGEG